MLVIENLSTPVELAITQVDDSVKMRLFSQFINEVSRVLQNLLKCFNGTFISKSFVLPAAWVFPVMFILDLNDYSQLTITAHPTADSYCLPAKYCLPVDYFRLYLVYYLWDSLKINIILPN